MQISWVAKFNGSFWWTVKMWVSLRMYSKFHARLAIRMHKILKKGIVAMEYNIDIDRVTELLTEIANEVPDEIFRNLNLGILVSEEVKINEESKPGLPLYTLGVYTKNAMGRQIVIYYGSFMRAFGNLEESAIKVKLEETLKHELLHHMENQGGEFGLEFEDYLRMQNYKSLVRKSQQAK